jgi:hypothetical protein
MKKTPFRLTPYQVQFLLVVGFVTVGYALYLRYLAVELSTTAAARFGAAPRLREVGLAGTTGAGVASSDLNDSR